MAVYVTPLFDTAWRPEWKFSKGSRLYADSEEELHEFAKSIGLSRKWCSDFHVPQEKTLYYTLRPADRRKALEKGALETPHKHGPKARA